MISVCIATFNGEKFIRQQLESILMQLGESDEIIISDDGSTDNTLGIIQALKDKRINVILHEEKVRTKFPLDASTHNFAYALSHAKGEYIFLADQDDVWLDGKICQMMQALQTADFVLSDCRVTDARLNVLYPSYFKVVRTRLGIWKNIVKSTYLGCCLAFKKEVLECALPFPHTKVGHDQWLGFIAELYFKPVLLDKPLVLYRKHDNSQTPSGMKSSYSLFFKISYRMTVIKELFKKVLICWIKGKRHTYRKQ